jgi:hypothetical protein
MPKRKRQSKKARVLAFIAETGCPAKTDEHRRKIARALGLSERDVLHCLCPPRTRFDPAKARKRFVASVRPALES